MKKDIKNYLNSYNLPKIEPLILIKQIGSLLFFFFLPLITISQSKSFFCFVIEYISSYHINLQIFSIATYGCLFLIIIYFIFTIRKKYFASKLEMFSLYTLLIITYHISTNATIIYEIDIHFGNSATLLLELLLLILVLVLFSLIIKHFFGYIDQIRKKENKENMFLEDSFNFWKEKIKKGSHITKPSEEISNIIKSNNFDKSFSIGITGHWGSGKSSLLSIVKDHLKNEKNIVLVDFKPFHNHNQNEIIEYFFDIFKDQLRKYDGTLSNKIIDYAKKLNEVYENKTFGTIINNIFDYNNKSSDTLYIEINKSIKKINKKFVIFIDDLDRLQKEEIFHVLRLIRSTANFYNTFFITAIDKTQIIKQLNHINSNHTNYLDKFFQLEVFIPKINHWDLKIFFIEQLKEKTKLSFNENYSFNFKLFNFFIFNYRDIIRLVNQINFESLLLKKPSSIDHNDLIVFSIFKLRYPEIFEKLKLNHNEYLVLNNGYYELENSKTVAPLSKQEEIIDDYNSQKKGLKLIFDYLFGSNPNKSDKNICFSETFSLALNPNSAILSTQGIKNIINDFKKNEAFNFSLKFPDAITITKFLNKIGAGENSTYTDNESFELFKIIIILFDINFDKINHQSYFKTFDKIIEFCKPDRAIEFLYDYIKDDYFNYPSDSINSIILHIDDQFKKQDSIWKNHTEKLNKLTENIVDLFKPHRADKTVEYAWSVFNFFNRISFIDKEKLRSSILFNLETISDKLKFFINNNNGLIRFNQTLVYYFSNSKDELADRLYFGIENIPYKLKLLLKLESLFSNKNIYFPIELKDINIITKTDSIYMLASFPYEVDWDPHYSIGFFNHKKAILIDTAIIKTRTVYYFKVTEIKDNLKLFNEFKEPYRSNSEKYNQLKSDTLRDIAYGMWPRPDGIESFGNFIFSNNNYAIINPPNDLKNKIKLAVLDNFLDLSFFDENLS
ncbi:P-loop NTPase fold protein [uncultured Tenacibaculum sp.]|uniref:KAP family P-loop NTPase fold protein n=1 Tax=uncultured Tenacibaculum sp. TaxID=174713 RepID=UPI002637D082|nr:P-loop NTPase fold protein [uncultured Tenacibaculum sp.]